MTHSAIRTRRIREGLYRAMKSGEVAPDSTEALQLAADLTVHAFPEATPPDRLDSFSLMVGFVYGAAAQCYEDE